MKKLASLMMAIVLVMSMMMVSASASEGVFAPLYQGAKDTRTDTRVAAMQKKLIELDFLNSKADGKFGPKTLAALKTFQLANGLPVTGVYDEDDDNRLYSGDVVNARGGNGAVKTVSSTSGSSSTGTSSSRTTTSGRTSTRNTNTPDNTRNTPDNTRNTPDNTRNTPDNTRNTPDNTRNTPDNT